MRVDLKGWNDNQQFKPEVKDQLNESARSDDCWVLISRWFHSTGMVLGK